MKMQVEYPRWWVPIRAWVVLVVLTLAAPLTAQVDRYQLEIPADVVAALTAARELRREGGYARAIENLTSLVEAQPDYYLAWYNLGLAQAQSGAHTAAVASLERALALQQERGIEDPTILNSLGWTLYLCGDYQAARPLLARAVEQPGLSANSRRKALNNLGSVLLRLQEYESAEQTLGRAKDLGSSRAKVNLKVLDAARRVAREKPSHPEGGGGLRQ